MGWEWEYRTLHTIHREVGLHFSNYFYSESLWPYKNTPVEYVHTYVEYIRSAHRSSTWSGTLITSSIERCWYRPPKLSRSSIELVQTVQPDHQQDHTTPGANTVQKVEQRHLLMGNRVDFKFTNRSIKDTLSAARMDIDRGILRNPPPGRWRTTSYIPSLERQHIFFLPCRLVLRTTASRTYDQTRDSIT